MVGIIIVILGILIGIALGNSVAIPYLYTEYITVAILACLDSAFGAYVANMQNKYSMKIFLSGFFGNAIIAIILVFIGDKLNVDIYLAAVIVFSSRIINNFSAIRREYFIKIDKNINDKINKDKSKKEK